MCVLLVSAHRFCALALCLLGACLVQVLRCLGSLWLLVRPFLRPVAVCLLFLRACSVLAWRLSGAGFALSGLAVAPGASVSSSCCCLLHVFARSLFACFALAWCRFCVVWARCTSWCVRSCVLLLSLVRRVAFALRPFMPHQASQPPFQTKRTYYSDFVRRFIFG